MVPRKLKMELIANQKSRYRTFRNRQKGLKKKLHELSTLCDVKAFMIIYDPNANGTSSSQPEIWPEDRNEVECIIEKYMQERKEDYGKRRVDLSDVLLSRKNGTDLELPKLQEKNVKTNAGVDEFSYEKLMEIIDRLDKKHEAVQNMINLKKRKETLINETTVSYSPIQGLSAVNPVDIQLPMDDSSYQSIGMIEHNLGLVDQGTGVVESDLGFMMNRDSAVNPVDIQLPMDYSSYQGIGMIEHNLGLVDQGTGVVESDLGFMTNRVSAVNPVDIQLPMGYSSYQDIGMIEHNLGAVDQGTGVVESDLGFMMNRVGMLKMGNNEYAEFGGDRASSSDIQYNTVQCQDPVLYHPALGVSENMVVNIDPRIPMQHMPTFMQYYPMMSTALGTDSIFW